MTGFFLGIAFALVAFFAGGYLIDWYFGTPRDD